MILVSLKKAFLIFGFQLFFLLLAKLMILTKTEESFDKWKNYCLVNPEIEDVVQGKTRKVTEEDWYSAAVASLVETKCLNF